MTSSSGAALRIVIFTDEPGWHGAQLKACFAAYGAQAEYHSLLDCDVDLAANAAGLVIGRHPRPLPDAVFVRGVPGGSLEAITLRLDLLHRLAALGVPVINSARTIERTVDKAMTSLLLHRHAIATPQTFVSESLARSRAYVETTLARGVSLVKKPLFGSQGKGLRRVRTVDDLGYLMPGEVCYLQHFVAVDQAPYRDYRVMVVEGRAVAAMERVSDHWITNRAQGADCHALPLNDKLVELAEAAALAVAADYAGVDLLHAPDGRWLVIEVNGIPAWQGLQFATGIDISALLAGACLRRIAVAAASR